MAAFDRRLIFEYVAVGGVRCHASVYGGHTSEYVWAVALEERRIALDDSRAAALRHATDQLPAVEVVPIEHGMIVLDIAAAIRDAAGYVAVDS